MLWHHLLPRETWPQFSGISPRMVPSAPPEPWSSRPNPISSLMDLLFHHIGENIWIVVVGYNGLIKFCALDTHRPELHWLTFCSADTAPIDSLPQLEVWHASIDSQSITSKDSYGFERHCKPIGHVSMASTKEIHFCRDLPPLKHLWGLFYCSNEVESWVYCQWLILKNVQFTPSCAGSLCIGFDTPLVSGLETSHDTCRISHSGLRTAAWACTQRPLCSGLTTAAHVYSWHKCVYKHNITIDRNILIT